MLMWSIEWPFTVSAALTYASIMRVMGTLCVHMYVFKGTNCLDLWSTSNRACLERYVKDYLMVFRTPILTVRRMYWVLKTIG